jgi:hypothetical protein
VEGVGITEGARTALLPLTDIEARALAHALDSYLPELAEEAARMERQPDAHELWERYEMLQLVRGRLPDAGDAPSANPLLR